MGKADLGKSIKGLNAALSELGWSDGSPGWSTNIRDPKQICFLHSSLEEFENPEGKDDNEKPYFKYPETMVSQSSQIRTFERARVSWPSTCLGIRVICTYVGKMARGQRMAGTPKTKAPYTVVPTPAGEAPRGLQLGGKEMGMQQ